MNYARPRCIASKHNLGLADSYTSGDEEADPILDDRLFAYDIAFSEIHTLFRDQVPLNFKEVHLSRVNFTGVHYY